MNDHSPGLCGVAFIHFAILNFNLRLVKFLEIAEHKVDSKERKKAEYREEDQG